MPEPIVEVDLRDLQALIQDLMRNEIDFRCHVGAARQLADPFVRSRYADDMSKSEGQAGDAVFSRYRELIEALNSGENVRAALSKFAGQQNWHS